jgi:subtilisin
MNTQIQKKNFTGRSLILLNDQFIRQSLFKTTSTSSFRLVHFNDFLNKPQNFIQAFTEGDGIYFESINVAVINTNHANDVKKNQHAFPSHSVLFIEPERYVYKISSYDYLRGYRDGINNLIEKLKHNEQKVPSEEVIRNMQDQYVDTEQCSWGITATRVMESSFTGKGINIAVLDTGLFKEHADLSGRKIKTKTFVAESKSGDADGHGSHCVGVACGFSDGSGMRYGVARNSNIFCGKVLDDRGEGTDAGILAGIEWAILNKCKVISMSLGSACEVGEPYSEIYENVAQRAMQQGSLIVAAAGNESYRPMQIAPVGHPANCPSIMSVGAIDNLLNIAVFSCGGINKNGGQVDIAAPGIAVFSMINEQNEHAKWDGTSMATPYLAGIAGLYFEKNPSASPAEIWALLMQHAKRLNLSSTDVGSGLVQAPVD